MKVSYLLMPEDSRNDTVNGIDFSFSLERNSVLKTIFWITVSIALTVALAHLG